MTTSEFCLLPELECLRHTYRSAEQRYDIEAQAKCYVDFVQYPVEQIPKDILDFFNQNIKILIPAVFQALHRYDGKTALTYLDCIADGGEDIPFFNFYRGIAFYCAGDWTAAEESMQRYLKLCSSDDTAWFYLGNIHFRQGRWSLALDDYIHTLERRESCFEATANAALTLSKLGQRSGALELLNSEQIHLCWLRGDVSMFPWKSQLNIKDTEYQQIPIFINSRDRLSVLQRLIEWLLWAGYTNIYVLDNDSTYPQLLQYYAEIEHRGIRIIRFCKNWGHRAIWDSGILEELRIQTPYVYTDSDIVPMSCCPQDILRKLLGILRRYPFLVKAGLGLYCDDITTQDAEKIRKHEKQFYRHALEPDLYFGAIDTTFALYRNTRVYTLIESARTTGEAMAYHLPWYYDYDNLPEDESYYIVHATASSTQALRILNYRKRIDE